MSNYVFVLDFLRMMLAVFENLNGFRVYVLPI